MSELEGLELRRAALQASGWKIEADDQGQWSVIPPDGHRIAWAYPSMAWIMRDAAPAVESDPSVSEPWFLEWCETNGCEWNISMCLPHEQHKQKHIVVWVHNETIDAEGSGATPSEARARAIANTSQSPE